MNKYVSRGLWTVLVTGGFMALGVGVAHADTATSGEDGIASGTQGILGIEAPVQLGGNAISIFGDADSSGATTSSPATSAPADASAGTSGSDSVAGGTQVLPELGVPITVGGNSISVFGDASSTAASTAAPSGSDDGTAASGSTDGTNGVLSGTQVLGDVVAPVTLGGNAISVLGDASSSDAGTASGSADAGDQEGSTSGTDGILGGSQVLADAGAPVTLGGNAISLFGDASSSGSSATPAGEDDATGGTSDPTPGTTEGTDGTVGGTRLLATLGVPLTLGGTTVSVVGEAAIDGAVTAPGSDPAGDPGDDGSELPTYALAADDVTALAATGVEGGLTALGLAVMLLTVGGALLARRATTHRR